ncbi:MAG: hypothetical protein GXP32_01285 [Kiritimatiellaeota bacterium]|nr:hypothetical protein [Kiritimatiellota bacterium]
MNTLTNENLKVKKRKTAFFLVLLAVACLPSVVSATESMISKMRVKKIARIIKEYTSVNEKLTDPFVQKDILDRVAKEFTLEPDEEPNTTPVSEIAREVRKLVSKRFPDTIKKIKFKAKKEANRKFKMKEKLDFVTVKVQKGRSTYTISGIFYGFGVGGKSVRIGDNLPIACFDLSSADRAKFDKAFCEEMKKKYISKKIRRYFDRKQSYLNILFRDKLEELAKENEKLGYIYRWNKWRTPKDVTEYLIQQQIRQQKLHATTDDEGSIEVASKPDSTRPNDTVNPKAPATPYKKPGGGLVGKSSPDGKNGSKSDLRLAKLKAAIEKKQMEIAGSQYGVDADQMFRSGERLVLIGMVRDEVNFVLAGLIPENSNENVETITFDKGILNSASLYFLNDVLYKVRKDYRIGPPEAMKRLLTHFRELYGDAIEDVAKAKLEKERLGRLAKIRNLCKKGKHNWTGGGTCKTCHVKKVDLQPPPLKLAQTLTWKGEIITAQIKLKLTPKFDNFESFILTKENSELRIIQKRVLRDVEKQQTEKQKRKEIEEYEKQIK